MWALCWIERVSDTGHGKVCEAKCTLSPNLCRQTLSLDFPQVYALLERKVLSSREVMERSYGLPNELQMKISMKLGTVYLKVLFGVIIRIFCTIFEKSWKLGEDHWLQVPLTGKDRCLYSSSKKTEEYKGTNTPWALPQSFGRLWRKMEAIFKHLMDKKVIENSQYGYLPSQSCLTTLISRLNDWLWKDDDNGCCLHKL